MLIKRLLNRNAAQLNGSNGLCPFSFCAGRRGMDENKYQPREYRTNPNYGELYEAQGEKESGLPFIMHSKSIKKIWSKYEINFQIIDFLNRMELRFKYDASLYSERYISSILSRFLKILQRFIESENCSIKNLLESGE